MTCTYKLRWACKTTQHHAKLHTTMQNYTPPCIGHGILWSQAMYVVLFFPQDIGYCVITSYECCVIANYEWCVIANYDCCVITNYDCCVVWSQAINVLILFFPAGRGILCDHKLWMLCCVIASYECCVCCSPRTWDTVWSQATSVVFVVPPGHGILCGRKLWVLCLLFPQDMGYCVVASYECCVCCSPRTWDTVWSQATNVVFVVPPGHGILCGRKLQTLCLLFPQDMGYCVVASYECCAVSYTHLTLPTMAVV